MLLYLYVLPVLNGRTIQVLSAQASRSEVVLSRTYRQPIEFLGALACVPIRSSKVGHRYTLSCIAGESILVGSRSFANAALGPRSVS